MSLEVKINSKSVRLPEDFELAINLKNSLLDDDREDATYPMEVNLASNREVFGFIDRAHTDVNEEMLAEVDFGPFQLLGGRCVLTDVGGGNVEFYVSTTKNSFWGQAKNRWLDDSCGGQFSNPGNQLDTLTRFSRSLTERMDYVVCPLRDSWMRNMVDTEVDFYNYLEPGETSFRFSLVAKPIFYTPFLRVTVVMKKILERMGYTIGVDEFSIDENLKDLLIICRRNPIDVNLGSDAVGKYLYGAHLPHISIYSFLREIENKFGYNFIVDEGRKHVDIQRLSFSRVKETMVFDGMEKHFLTGDDRVKGIVYKDTDSTDEGIKQLAEAGLLHVVFGQEDDAETVDCISTIVGVGSDIKKFNIPNVETNYQYEYRFAAFQEGFSDAQDYRDRIETDLRFSIYRGMIKASPVNDSGRRYEFDYPVASPIPEDDKNGTFSLLWNGIDNNLSEYVKDRALLLIGAKQTNEFYVCPDMKNLDNLKEFFSHVLIVRNRKYLCYEQEIVLGNNVIVSHVLRCYPV